MSQPSGSGPPRQRNKQVYTATNGGTVYANQNGAQHINNTVNVTNNHTIKHTRSRSGWAVLVIFVVDVAFFFYGQAAYTGEPGDSSDLWRAGIFLALLIATGTLIRNWFRRR